MKIVSKTKDYYDHVANILGVDEKLRYERQPYRVVKLNDGSPFFPEYEEFTIPRTVEDDYREAYPTSPFFRQIIRDDWRDRRSSQALFVAGRAFTVWSDITGKDEFNNTTFGPRLARKEVECPDWLHGLSYNLCQPVFLVLSLRPGHVYGRTGKVTVLNVPPNLADMGLPRLLDAFSAYSGIQTWMENMRAVGDALNGIPEADNNTKIQAAGFDLKTSFRKR